MAFSADGTVRTLDRRLYVPQAVSYPTNDATKLETAPENILGTGILCQLCHDRFSMIGVVRSSRTYH
jgi:hypothetical protein